jgi:cation:H+ antiporter
MVVPTPIVDVAVGAVALSLLVKSAEVAVTRSLALAEHYDVPDVLVGMTVVAVGTSLPEIGSHLIASAGIVAGTLDYRVASATVLGGNMGSSTAQQTLLFGIFLVGYGRIELSKTFLRANYLPMVLAAALTLVVAWDGTISQLDGLLLFGSYLVYVYYSITRRERRLTLPETESRHVRRDAVVTVLALLGVLVGAYLVLTTVETLVDRLALGGSMIGVVTLGLASALPELSTVAQSIKRRAPNLALGTLVGSNVVNPLVGIGLGGAVSTYAVPSSVVLWDLPFKLAVGVGLYGYLTLVSDRRLTRMDGFYFVVLYFVFVGARLVLFPSQ